MGTQARRLAMITAMLWFGFGVGSQAEAGPVLQTPAGLSPGDHFRFVFITSGTTDATSTNITDYDNFVTTQAGGATYNGVVLPWLAIGSTSTPTVAAINHVVPSSGPVFLADGTEVATSTTTSGLWSGSLQHPINETLTGPSHPNNVWTGTERDGQIGFIVAIDSSLGDPQPLTGDPDAQDRNWVFRESDFRLFPSTTPLPIYGITPELTVSPIPEPSSLCLLGTGLSVGLASAWSRHRREQRRQRPVGQPDETETV